MRLLSNNTKVALYADNFMEAERVHRKKCYVVEHYDFCLQRNRNSQGIAYGDSSGCKLSLKITIGSRENLHIFYERLKETFMSSFTLLFNVKYDEWNFVTDDYDGGIIATGYVIDVLEEYQYATATSNEQEFMLTVLVLVNKLSVIGNSKTVDFVFNN